MQDESEDLVSSSSQVVRFVNAAVQTKPLKGKAAAAAAAAAASTVDVVAAATERGWTSPEELRQLMEKV